MKHLFPLLLATLASACIVVVDDDGFTFGTFGSWDGDTIRGSGHRATELREVDVFTSVRLACTARAEIHVGEAPALEVSGDDDLLEHVTTRVEDGRLHVRLPDRYRPNARLRFRIGTPSLEGVRIEGSGDVVVHGAHGPELSLVIDGSGDIEASGEVDHLTAKIDGSGRLDLEELRARDAHVRIDGSGNISVFASESLTYRIGGSGDVVVLGDGQVEGSISGSGTVRRR